mmetsp:Transcript_34698/g.108332  ORF Transcript_34698/g.108332 Transcript_34698/m.108332 type:complete len:353 (+) Transcript_34698:656-1714(+)
MGLALKAAQGQLQGRVARTQGVDLRHRSPFQLRPRVDVLRDHGSGRSRVGRRQQHDMPRRHQVDQGAEVLRLQRAVRKETHSARNADGPLAHLKVHGLAEVDAEAVPPVRDGVESRQWHVVLHLDCLLLDLVHLAALDSAAGTAPGAALAALLVLSAPGPELRGRQQVAVLVALAAPLAVRQGAACRPPQGAPERAGAALVPPLQARGESAGLRGAAGREPERLGSCGGFRPRLSAGRPPARVGAVLPPLGLQVLLLRLPKLRRRERELLAGLRQLLELGLIVCTQLVVWQSLLQVLLKAVVLPTALPEDEVVEQRVGQCPCRWHTQDPQQRARLGADPHQQLARVAALQVR